MTGDLLSGRMVLALAWIKGEPLDGRPPTAATVAALKRRGLIFWMGNRWEPTICGWETKTEPSA